MNINKKTLLMQNCRYDPNNLQGVSNELYPLWEVPDGLWERIEQILPREKKKGSVGSAALPNRQVLNGFLFVLWNGCQWKGLKKEWFGASSSLHKRFQEWNESGVWKKIYRMVVKDYQKKCRIQWKWQAVDSKMVPAPLGGDLTGPNPTNRAKSGSKRHIWVTSVAQHSLFS